MAFVVEDGSGLPDSTAYISVAAFQSYHTDRGNDFSLYSVAQIQQAIIRATDYIDRRNRGKFVGIRTLETQAREWPRVDAYYFDGRVAIGIVSEIREATAEYALRGLGESLAPDPVYDERNQVVTGVDVVVGPLRESIQYASSGAVQPVLFRDYPEVDALFAELVEAGVRLRRA